jgi:hypothetical protein
MAKRSRPRGALTPELCHARDRETIARRQNGAVAQNANGDVLELSGPQAGFQVSSGLAGMTIALR